MAEGDIDFDQKLDPDTRLRLLERNRWQEVEENDRRFPESEQEGGDPASPEADGNSDEGDDGDTTPDTPEDEMVKGEIKAELKELGVEFNSRASKAELVELLKGAHAAGE
jgi:hypothetical protein